MLAATMAKYPNCGWKQVHMFWGVLGTWFGSLELKIGSLESEKLGPYRCIWGT